MNLDLAALAPVARAAVPDALFVTVSGAHLYGFPSADSDIDLRGCHRVALRDLVGLRPPRETIDRKLTHGGAEVELVSHDAGKYLRLMCKHNGYVLEQILSPLVVLGGDFLARLRPLARRSVTRGCHRHYRGFLQSRLKLLEGQEPKSAKGLLYAYRVVLTGIHALTTGEIQPHLPTLNETFRLPFIEELIARKQAAEQGGLAGLDWAYHRDQLAGLERRLDAAYAESALPEEPPWRDVNEFLIELRLGRGHAATHGQN